MAFNIIARDVLQVKKIVFFLVLFNFFLSSNLYASEEKKFGLIISSGNDSSISKKLEIEILKEFKKQGFALSKSALKQLVIYINKDENDDINPNGWSLSIAHIDAYHVPIIVELIKNEAGDNKKIIELLAPLLTEHGFLKHLSSVHLSRGDIKQISIASKSIVTIFIAKNYN